MIELGQQREEMFPTISLSDQVVKNSIHFLWEFSFIQMIPQSEITSRNPFLKCEINVKLWLKV